MMQQTLRQNAILKLEEAKKKELSLSSYYQLYQDLLQIQEEAAVNITTSLDLVDEKILNERLRSGFPQLSFDLLAIDKSTFPDLVQEILDLLTTYQGEKVDIPLLTEEDLLGKAHERFLQTQSTDNADLLDLAIDQSLMPYLELAAGQVMLHVDTKKWLRGNCPCCGAEPNFACLDAEGSRVLICSRCRYEFQAHRLPLLWQY